MIGTDSDGSADRGDCDRRCNSLVLLLDHRRALERTYASAPELKRDFLSEWVVIGFEIGPAQYGLAHGFWILPEVRRRRGATCQDKRRRCGQAQPPR